MMSMRIPNDYQAREHAKEAHGEKSLEHRVLIFLHGKTVQVILASLLFLDVLIIFAELTLWTMFPHCSIIQRDGISCCLVATNDNAAVATEEEHQDGAQDGGRYLLLLQRFLSGGGGDADDSHHGQDFCATGLEAQFENEIGCDEHKWYRVHTAEQVLFGLTMTILSIFMLELLILIIAIRPWIFFRHFFYALDFVVVSGSIVLESIFHTLGNDLAQTYASFLIVIRLWRFVRIGHGITELITEAANEKYQELLAYTEELESILKDNNLHLPAGSLRPTSRHGNKVVTPDILETIEERERMEMRKKLKRVEEDEQE